jgi:hypothetical protein
MQFKNNQIIFAVTDHNAIVPLVVSNVEADVEDLEGWLEVTTELADQEASPPSSNAMA